MNDLTDEDDDAALSDIDLLSSHSALLTALDTFNYLCDLSSLSDEHEKSLDLNSVLRDTSTNVSERLNYIMSDKTITQKNSLRQSCQSKLLE